MTRCKSLIAALACLMMLTPLASCGTTDATDTDPNIERSYVVGTVEKNDDIAAMLPDTVTKDGKLTVGSNLTYAPAEFLANDGKTPVGYEIDLAKALGDVFGLQVDIVNSSFDTIIPSVGVKYDIGMSGFTVSEERIEAVDFVTFARAGLSFAVRKGNPTNADPKHLCGMRIAVQTGTVGETVMYDAQDQCMAEGEDPIELLPYQSQSDVTTALVAGRVDLLYTDTPVAGFAVKQTEGQLELLGEDESVEPMGIAIAKGDDATAEAVKAAMEELAANGTYKAIMEAWGVEDIMMDSIRVNM